MIGALRQRVKRGDADAARRKQPSFTFTFATPRRNRASLIGPVDYGMEIVLIYV